MTAALLMFAARSQVAAANQEKRTTLARHEAVAEYQGMNCHRCAGRTALCPDRCGHSGMMASFLIHKHLKHARNPECGDPEKDRFVVMLDDHHRSCRPTAPKLNNVVASLQPGDAVLLFWTHDGVALDDQSWPERVVSVLEKIASLGSTQWMEQVDRAAAVRDEQEHGPSLGSTEWLNAISRKLGVVDPEGHGPDYDSDEWRRAVHRKAFGLEPEHLIRAVYRSHDGAELRVTFDNLRRTVTLHLPEGDLMLPQAVSASGARYVSADEEFWNKGARASYRKGGVLIFEGESLDQCAEAGR